MARKTHWKALARSQKKRRWNRVNGLLIAIFGRTKGAPQCCTPENPCNPRYDDDWIRDFREFPISKADPPVSN